jgi:hypothetical protein
MAKRSIAFVDFLRSYKKLDSIYLPNRKSNQPPTDVEIEHARAFITLFHAEVEQYLESTCYAMLDATIVEFNAGSINLAALGLIAFGKLEERVAGPVITPSPKKSVRKITERFREAVSAHQDAISKNNGISQGYLACLFIPLGLTNHLIDPGWVSELQSLADKRGGFAHKGRLTPEGQPRITPKDAINYARKVIHGVGGAASGVKISSLKDFDNWSQETNNFYTSLKVRPKKYWGFKHRIGWWLIKKIGNNQRVP